MRLRALSILIALLAVEVLPVHAAEFSSASFIVRDPVMETASGLSSSGSFEQITAEGQTAVGESSGANFAVQSGFLYYGTPQLAQSTYRWYSNTDAVTPVTPLAAEDTSVSSVASGTVLRLRLALRAPSDPVAIGTQFKLQYAAQGLSPSCAAVPSGSFSDVGAVGSGVIWRGYDNTTPSDGATLPSHLISTAGATGSLETYEEANPSAPTPDYVYVGVNSNAEWDWVIQNNSAASNTAYCFRMVYGTGTILDTYSVFPGLTTAVTPGGGGGGGGGVNPINYSLVLQNGSACTPSRSVSVQLASQNASYYEISNNQDFIGSDWLPLSLSPMIIPWTLTAGDGVKQVYVLYRSYSGSVSAPSSAIITLDEANQCQGAVPQQPAEPTQPTEGGITSGVIVFTEKEYHGRSQVFSMDTPDLRSELIGNDTIASIRIIGNVRVKLFEHINYAGQSEEFDSSDPDLSNNGIGANRVSSLQFIFGAQKVITDIARPAVQLFQHINFLGTAQKLEENAPDLRATAVGNDQTSALKLIGKALAWVFEHVGFKGISQLFSRDTADLRGTLLGNDRASSVRVLTPGSMFKADTATVYFYGADGLMHPFQNIATYFSWFANFNQLNHVQRSDLNPLHVGAPIVYRPGVRMVKLTTSPEVYAVAQNMTLRWIQNETIAAALYGDSWARYVDDISVSTFEKYQRGDSISDASQFDPIAAAQSQPIPTW